MDPVSAFVRSTIALDGSQPRSRLRGTGRSDRDYDYGDAAVKSALRIVMTDHSDLIRRADDLRRQAEHELDEKLRRRLLRMADRYVHLADSQSWSQAHRADVGSMSELSTKRD